MGFKCTYPMFATSSRNHFGKTLTVPLIASTYHTSTKQTCFVVVVILVLEYCTYHLLFQVAPYIVHHALSPLLHQLTMCIAHLIRSTWIQLTHYLYNYLV